MAYRQFLTSNGISHDHVEEAEYGHVLESQKLVGQDLDRLTDTSAARDVSLNWVTDTSAPFFWDLYTKQSTVLIVKPQITKNT